MANDPRSDWRIGLSLGEGCGCDHCNCPCEDCNPGPLWMIVHPQTRIVHGAIFSTPEMAQHVLEKFKLGDLGFVVDGVQR